MSLKYLPLTIIISFNLLTACSGDNSIGKLFAPDPKLKEKQEKPTTSSAPSTPSILTPEVQLPDNFPSEIPIYSQAKLVATELGNNQKETQTFWITSVPIDTVFEYYEKQLNSSEWQIKNQDNILQATKDNLSLELSLVNNNSETKYLLKYTKENTSPETTEKPVETVTNTPSTTPSINTSPSENIPDNFQQYINDISALGIIETQDLNQGITRREFASWLFKINNLLYQDSPGKQIRLASTTSQPVFTDIPKNDPDFTIIQGLAEAGLIPSSLTNELTAVTFNPNNNLTREDLILWKIPLDSRQALPTASLEAIKQTWGFQDAAKINPKTLQALLVDFQNGEQSNVKRVFGYTTLFQPKKAVTRAEAIASLWYFGYQNDGKSVREVNSNNTNNTNN